MAGKKCRARGRKKIKYAFYKSSSRREFHKASHMLRDALKSKNPLETLKKAVKYNDNGIIKDFIEKRIRQLNLNLNLTY